MIKIVHLTSVHTPFDVRIFHKECRTLAEADYQVVLIAPAERHEIAGKVRIHAVPRRKGQLARMTGTVAKILGAAWEEDGALYHFHDPELIPVGLLLKLMGRRVLYDAHENVPDDILTKQYLPAWVRKVVSATMGMLEQIGARFFDGVIAVTPTIAGRFPQDKTVLIRNFPLVEEWLCLEPIPYADRPACLAYVGRISVDRGIKTMVEAMGRLPAGSKARLMLAGLFDTPALKAEVKKTGGWERVDDRGWLSQDELRRALREVRIGLVPLHPWPSYLSSYPIKLFEYMAAGIPVIASDFPLWREIIGKRECGLLVDPLDPRAIAEAIQWLLAHPNEAARMGEKGREAVAAEFNWADEGARLCQFYRKLLSN